ncbi:MAG TPA: hypothetical protein VGF95_09935 [Solirubrobacteraceae bacterium]
MSMLCPQQLQLSTEEEAILPIVECSPQWGQTDASSKRCRQ